MSDLLTTCGNCLKGFHNHCQDVENCLCAVEESQPWFSKKPVLAFEDWYVCYGICDCGLDVVTVDRETDLDDKCHRHKFARVME